MFLRSSATLGLVMVWAVTSGCAPPEAPAPDDSTAPVAEAQGTAEEKLASGDDLGALANRVWSLETFGVGDVRVPPLEGTEITLAFSGDGRTSGAGGCNRYFGSYESGESGALSFGQIATTRMACPTEIMDQEKAFLQALGDMDRYEIDGDRLRLRNADGTGVLTFVEPAVPPSVGE